MTDLNPTTNPDAQEALSLLYSNSSIRLLPLRSGRFAIFDRSFTLHDIVDPEELPDAETLRALSHRFNLRLTNEARLAAEAKFLGEPTPEEQARDIRRASRPPTIPRSKGTIIEIEL